MANDRMKKILMSFSVEELKSFLGRDLVESLLEWNSNNEAFASKKRLSEMIMSIYGSTILKDKLFRKKVIKSFSPDEVLSFRDYLPDDLKQEEDLETIVEYVGERKWTNSPINEYFVRLLGYDSRKIFEKNDLEEESVEKIESYNQFYELLDYQYIIRQRALNILNSQYDLRRFLIHMPTGTGKTKTAIHIICHYYNYSLRKKGLILWIAHTKELLQQAHDTFKSVWRNIGNGEIEVYKLWGDAYFDIPNGGFNGFMICGIQKLQSIKNLNKSLFEAILRDVRLIVYDEAHKASADETRALIEQLMNRKGDLEDRSLMGLSATPGRTTVDSFDNNILVSMFGNKIIGIDTRLMNAVNLSAQEAANTEAETDVIKYFQDRGVLSKIKKEELTYPESLTEVELEKIKVITYDQGYEDFSKKALETIGKNRNRNRVILNRIKELNYERKPTIVFACSVKHAQLLSAMLSLENIENAVVIGNMPASERKEAIERFKDRTDNLNILINYEVLTTGFDATNIECVFIARPTQSVVLYSQMLGRGLRGPQMGGNEECLLIDVKDNLVQYNENMAFSHFNNYWSV